MRGDSIRLIRLVHFGGTALLAVLLLSACFGGGGGGSAPTATLRVFAGSVEVSVDDATFSAGSEGQILAEGSTVRTAADGRAAIEWFDGSVTRLDHDTTFKIVTMAILDNDEQSKVIEGEQTSGNTYNRVTELTDAASRFDIETPTATASVQGTVYAVILNPDGSMTVAVIEGEVDAGGGPVPAGFMVIVSPDGLVGDPVPIPDDLIDDDWIVYNCELDEGPDCPDEGSTTTTTVLGPDESPTTTAAATTTTTVAATTTSSGGGPTTTAAATTTTISGPDEPPTTTTAAVTTSTSAATTSTSAATTSTSAATTSTSAATTSTSAATTSTSATTTSSQLGSILLEGSSEKLAPQCTRTYTATLRDAGGNIIDDDSTVVVFADANGRLGFVGGPNATASNGVATKQVIGSNNGAVSLTASVGGIQSAPPIVFEVVPPGDCGDNELVLGFPTTDRGGIDPLAALATLLLGLLGVAALSARRSVQRLA